MGNIIRKLPLANIMRKIAFNEKDINSLVDEIIEHSDKATAILEDMRVNASVSHSKSDIGNLVAAISKAEQLEKGFQNFIDKALKMNMGEQKKSQLQSKYALLSTALYKANKTLEMIKGKKDLNKAATPPELIKPDGDNPPKTPADLGYHDFCTRLANLQFTYRNLRSYPKKYDVVTLKEEARVLMTEIGQVVKQLEETEYHVDEPETHNVFVNLQHDAKVVYDNVSKITPLRF